jgi:hypothetical protein
MSVCMYVCVCMCVYVYACKYVWMYVKEMEAGPSYRALVGILIHHP